MYHLNITFPPFCITLSTVKFNFPAPIGCERLPGWAIFSRRLVWLQLLQQQSFRLFPGFFYVLTRLQGNLFPPCWVAVIWQFAFSLPGRRNPRGSQSSPGLLCRRQSEGDSSQGRWGGRRMEATELARKTTHWATARRGRLVQIPVGCSGSDAVDEWHVETDFNLWEGQVSMTFTHSCLVLQCLVARWRKRTLAFLWLVTLIRCISPTLCAHIQLESA